MPLPSGRLPGFRTLSATCFLAAAGALSSGCVSLVDRSAPWTAPGILPARPSASDPRSAVVAAARDLLGTPYQYGGTGEDGLDCSGLTQRVYRACGTVLPRTAADQFKGGRPRWREEVKLGDLVFFETEPGAGATHVGVFVGDGKFIHAPSSGKAVEISELANPYWAPRFLAGRDYLGAN